MARLLYLVAPTTPPWGGIIGLLAQGQAGGFAGPPPGYLFVCCAHMSCCVRDWDPVTALKYWRTASETRQCQAHLPGQLPDQMMEVVPVGRRTCGAGGRQVGCTTATLTSEYQIIGYQIDCFPPCAIVREAMIGEGHDNSHSKIRSSVIIFPYRSSLPFRKSITPNKQYAPQNSSARSGPVFRGGHSISPQRLDQLLIRETLGCNLLLPRASVLRPIISHRFLRVRCSVKVLLDPRLSGSCRALTLPNLDGVSPSLSLVPPHNRPFSSLLLRVDR